MDLTFGQRAMGVNFNPSNNPEVDRVKQIFADLCDAINDMTTTSYLGNTFKGMAIRALIEAKMAVVAVITFTE